MYEGLKHAHSGIRWIFLALLIYAVINAFLKWRGNKDYTGGDRKVGLFTFIFSHIQLLVGLGLYSISPRVEVIRFYRVEHISMMLLAIILISIGHISAKKAKESSTKFKRTFIFYLIALVLILTAIPWPPKHGAGWF